MKTLLSVAALAASLLTAMPATGKTFQTYRHAGHVSSAIRLAPDLRCQQVLFGFASKHAAGVIKVGIRSKAKCFHKT